MGNYNNQDEVTRKNFNGKGGKKPFKKGINPEVVAKKEEIARKQNESLDAIECAVKYFDDLIKNNTTEKKFKMTDFIEHMNANNYNTESLKFISQLNYIIIDLANAQINSHMSDYGKEVRVRYLFERLLTVFYMAKDRVNNIAKTYNSLFYFPGLGNEESTVKDNTTEFKGNETSEE